MTKDPATNPDAAAREISRLYGQMWHRFHTSRQPIVGASVTQRMLGVLRHLAGAGPLTVGEQAAHLGIGIATASELIDRLEAKQLVERMRDERDQRRVFIWLTKQGRRLLADFEGSPLDDPFARAVAALPVKTRRQIIDGLTELLEAADRGLQPSEVKKVS